MSDRDPAPWPVRLQSRLADALGVVAGVALLVMVALLSAHILRRWLTGTGIRGANEVSQYLMITLVYCGLAMTLRDGGFLRVDLLLSRLPDRVAGVINALVHLLSLGFMVLLTWRTWALMSQSYARGIDSIGVLRVPLWIPQSVVVVGIVALTLQILVHVVFPGAARDVSARDEAAAEMEEVEDVLERSGARTMDA
jgi:TRAP-type C4-dicarboxylate transport system permease small subunit